MFGFGNLRNALRPNDIFDVADVQELTQEFPPKTSLADKPEADQNELVLLASGEGLIARSALLRTLQNKLGREDGRLRVATLALEFDVAPSELVQIIHGDGTIFLSKDRALILTRSELRTVIEQLQRKAEGSFVPAAAFAEQWDMECEDVIRLVEISNEAIKEGPLQLFQDLKALPTSSKSASFPYIHTLSLLLGTKKSLTEKMTTAQEEAK